MQKKGIIPLKQVSQSFLYPSYNYCSFISALHALRRGRFYGLCRLNRMNRESAMSDLFNRNDEVLLTAAQIMERRKEYDSWGAQIEELGKKRRERLEWFKTVAKLIGSERAKALIGELGAEVKPGAVETLRSITRRKHAGIVTWTSFIEDFVRSVNRAVDYAELKAAVSKSVLGPKLAETEKSFYGAILKLTEKGSLVKKEGWLFSPEAYEEYAAKLSKGEVEELPRSSSHQHSRGSRLGDEIKLFLKRCPNGAPGKDIIQHMVQFEEFRQAVERNDTSVYNVLARLVKREEIRKIGTTYYSPEAPPNENSGSTGDAAV